MMDCCGSGKRRWYDEQQRVAQVVNLLLDFPGEMQPLIADGLNILAEKQFKADELMSSKKSLGKDKVLSLYKAASKARNYDRYPSVQKAVNYLHILPEESRDEMTRQLIQLYTYVYGYLKTYQTFNRQPAEEDIAILTRLYAESRLVDVNRFMQVLRARLEKDDDTHQPVLHELTADLVMQDAGGSMSVKTV